MSISQGLFSILAISRANEQNTKTEYKDLKAEAISSHRPSGAPALVSRLPAEILSTIFFYVQEHEKPEVGDISTCFPPQVYINGPEETTLGWITITHVCSHWRRIAIQTPALWSYVSLMLKSDRMSTVLERAHSTPLSILYTWDEDMNTDDEQDLTSEALDVVRDHVAHTQSLHISTSAPSLEALFSKLIVPAPVLDAVTFVAYDADETPIVSRLPPDLFDGNAPNIKTLSLVNCVVPWISPKFHSLVQNLVSLDIYFPRSSELWAVGRSAGVTIPRSELFPSVAQLRGLLSSATRLERLLLRSILPECVRFDFHQEDAIYLPNLTSYNVDGDVYSCTVVARHIFPSPNSRLELHCFFEEDEGTEAEYSAVVSALEHHISFWSQGSISTNVSEITLDLYLDCVRIVCDAYQIVVHSEWDSLRDDLTRTCLGLLSSLAPTKFLFNHQWTDETEFDLIHVLGIKALHTITELVAIMLSNLLAFQKLCDALCERSELDAATPSEQSLQHGVFLLFPRLRVLSMKWLSLQHFDQACMHSLRRVIALRREYGSPIERLELRSCRDVGGHLLEELRSIPGLQIVYDDSAPVIGMDWIIQEW